MKRLVLGVTGASGAICARSVLRQLIRHPDVDRVHVVLSRYALQTLKIELKARISNERDGFRALLGGGLRPGKGKAVLHEAGDMAAAISSGSYQTDGMIIVPCSGGTLSAVACGVSSNLLQRAAEVTLKERRPLILAFRETPLSLAHIENMRRATLAGAVIYPLTPAFYTGARELDAIVEQFTGRIFDLLQLPHTLGQRWGPSR